MQYFTQGLSSILTFTRLLVIPWSGLGIVAVVFRIYEDPEPATKGARSSSSKTELPRRTVPLEKQDVRQRFTFLGEEHSLDTLDDVKEGQDEECESGPVDELAGSLSDEDGEEGECDDLREMMGISMWRWMHACMTLTEAPAMSPSTEAKAYPTAVDSKNL
jgi:hypothetical protein